MVDDARHAMPPSTLTRLSPRTPLALDLPARAAPPVPEAPAAGGPAGPAPSAALWPNDDAEVSFIGIRVTAPLANPVALARRLAAAEEERGVIPVILSGLPVTGLEAFGFRVERLPATPGPERDRCEAELSRFWSLALVVEAGDAADFD